MVRRSADAGSDVLLELCAGDHFELRGVAGTSPDWFEVRTTDGLKGYLPKGIIVTSPPNGQKVVVDSPEVQVFSPGSNAMEPTGTLKGGQVILLFGTEQFWGASWDRVEFGSGKSGYIPSDTRVRRPRALWFKVLVAVCALPLVALFFGRINPVWLIGLFVFLLVSSFSAKLFRGK